MENLIQILSKTVGLSTIVSAIVVCLIMAFVKKKKPNLSPKIELIIRFLVSVLIRVIVTFITKKDFVGLAESSMSICGVSLIICAIFNKGDNPQDLKELVSAFLPNLSKEEKDGVFLALNENRKNIDVKILEESKEKAHSMQKQWESSKNQSING